MRDTDSILRDIHTSQLKIVLGVFDQQQARTVLCNVRPWDMIIILIYLGYVSDLVHAFKFAV